MNCPNCQSPYVAGQTNCPTCGSPYSPESNEASGPPFGHESNEAASVLPLVYAAPEDQTVQPQGATDQLPVQTYPPLNPTDQFLSSTDQPQNQTHLTPKKSKKGLAIGIAAALVLILGIGGVLGFNAFMEHQREQSYLNAQSLMSQGEYSEAAAVFENLGNYEKSETHLAYCQQGIEYQKACELLESGNYENALDAFFVLGTFLDSEKKVQVCSEWLVFKEAEALTEQGLYAEAEAKALEYDSFSLIDDGSTVSEWSNKNSYGLAGKLYEEGKFSEAYDRYTSLGVYRDSAEWAQACIQPLPASSELYHNDAFRSGETEVVYEIQEVSEPIFLKIYSGDTLVSSIFLHPNSSVKIFVPAGAYTVNQGTGENWFGESAAFGSKGVYQRVMFEGGSGDGSVTELESNMIYTFSLYYEFALPSIGGTNKRLDSGSF